ncbi:hypothetical protein ABL78_1691 [Leptomonas seymouri]|uniref:Glutathione S-transferase n=1 Tax=Leptomonas seymouri TaxID=5684 RepID=A0A0N1PD54_LEPSE|nr:hypothetical protein ABL78_1691 [Leptomonas seymouri]|eukprot:KPI89198.1 hypothetical protein ABL78_1691 [Leptomonas seymouri]
MMDTAKAAAESVSKSLRRTYRHHRKACLITAGVLGTYATMKTMWLVHGVWVKASTNRMFRSLEAGVVHLFLHPRWSHGPNLFPHCVKVECFLRLAKIPYVAHFTNDARMSPNGRLPFIVHNSTVLADGEFIIQYLTETLAVTMNSALTAKDHARGLMVRRMVETSINYGLNRTTFVDYPRYMADMFSKEYALEPILSNVLVRGMRNATIRVLNAVGYGTLSQGQYEEEFMRDVQSLETFLQDRDFLFGSTPTSYDCSVYAWLQVALEFGPNGNGLTYLYNSAPLRNYVHRMSKLAFPDFSELRTAKETQRFITAS